MQFEQKESTQQIADYKAQSSNNRAGTKDLKGNEQQVLLSGVSEDHSRSSINLFIPPRRWQRERVAGCFRSWCG